jgi:hypothetical protein
MSPTYFVHPKFLLDVNWIDVVSYNHSKSAIEIRLLSNFNNFENTKKYLQPVVLFKDFTE